MTLAIRLLTLTGAIAGACLGLVWLNARDLGEPDPYLVTGI